MADLARLKPGECVRLTRPNPDAAPFDPPGSAGPAAIESLARRAGGGGAGLFVLGTHTKKRPHALTLGRLYDGRLLDAVEFSVDPATARLLKAFGAAPTAAQAGHKPALAFVGSAWEADPAAGAAKSLLLDFLRGRVVTGINLAGLDRLILVVAEGGGGSGGRGGGGGGARLALRQFSLRLKKSGVTTPRVEAAEIGPALDLAIVRHLVGPPDLVKASLRAGVAPKKKVSEKDGVVFSGLSTSFPPPTPPPPPKKKEEAHAPSPLSFLLRGDDPTSNHSDTSCLTGVFLRMNAPMQNRRPFCGGGPSGGSLFFLSFLLFWRPPRTATFPLPSRPLPLPLPLSPSLCRKRTRPPPPWTARSAACTSPARTWPAWPWPRPRASSGRGGRRRRGGRRVGGEETRAERRMRAGAVGRSEEGGFPVRRAQVRGGGGRVT